MRTRLAAALTLTALAVAGCGEGGDEATAPTVSPTASLQPDDSPTTTTFPMTDGDWRLASLRLKNTFGSFSGTARIQYIGNDSNGGANVFTVSVFKAGKEIGTLQGGASEVKPGQTKTVTMISSDKYVRGPWRYSFQKDL